MGSEDRGAVCHQLVPTCQNIISLGRKSLFGRKRRKAQLEARDSSREVSFGKLFGSLKEVAREVLMLVGGAVGALVELLVV